MIAAIYARKSTSQAGRDEADKSVAHQVVVARAFATERGWTVADAHVYVDDGIRGAEFEDRDGLRRLLDALRDRRRPFDMLLLTDKDRLGREQYETAYMLKKIDEAGVGVWEVNHGRRINLDSPADRFLVSAMTSAGDMERGQASIRTASKFREKAQAGHVTGGRCYGYDNVEVKAASGKRQHVERRINDGEAEVVRRIFTLCAEGRGLRGIAVTVNDEGAVAPVPRRKGRPVGWAPSSVREVLHRSLYRGLIVWNRTQKRDRWGKKKQSQRPEAAWIRREAPELRIVPEELWHAAHERLDGVRQAYLRGTDGRLWGRPGSGIESKYLLTGLAICGACGGTLHVRTRSHGRKRAAFYGCSAHHLRGTRVCDNRLELPMVETDEALLSALEEDLLHPDAIALGLREAVETLSAPPSSEGADRCAAIRRELGTIDQQLGILKAALLQGGTIATLVEEMKAQERRKATLTAELAQRERPVEAVDARALEAELLRYVAEWRAVLRQHVTIARQVLRKLVAGRVCFTPKGETAEMVAPLSLDGMLATATLLPKAVVAPTGFEPVFQP